MRHPNTAPRPRHLPRASLLVLAGALAGVLGCGGGDDSTGPSPSGSAAGRYEIVQVNGDDSAPFTAFEATDSGVTYRLDILDGSIDLANDGTYTSLATTRISVNGSSQGEETQAQTGRYTANGNTVTFDPSGDDADEPNYTATRNGDTITLSENDPDFGVPLTVVARRS